MIRPARQLLRLVGPVLFLALVWYAGSDRIREVWSRTHAGPLLLAAVLNLPIIFVKAWRWRRLMRSQRILYEYRAAVRQYAIGAAIAAWTPGRLGDFTKAVAVARERSVSLGRAASSVIVDRVLDALSMAAFAALGLALIPGLQPSYRVALSLGAAVPVVLAGWLLVRPPGPSSSRRPVSRFVGLLGAVRGEIEATVTGMTDLVRARPVGPAAVTLPATLITFLQGYCVAWSLDLEIGFWRLSAGLAASALASLIPITVAGIGTREMVLILVLGSAGFTTAQVIGFSVSFLIIVQGSLALVGALAWILPGPHREDP